MKQCSYLMGLVFVAASGLLSAEDGFFYRCVHDKKARTIEVVYLQRESSVPCEVNYIKDDSQETLWNARYTEGYCEAKAAEFSRRQEEWGWSCQKVENPAATQSETVETTIP